MAGTTKREQNYKDLLLDTCYEYLYQRMKNPKTKDSSKEKIAIAMSKAGVNSHQKHDIPQLNGLAALIAKAAAK